MPPSSWRAEAASAPGSSRAVRSSIALSAASPFCGGRSKPSRPIRDVHLSSPLSGRATRRFMKKPCKGFDPGSFFRPRTGGATRQLSVAAGLEALASLAPSAVLIHDAARPFISAQCIGATLAALQTSDGAIAAAPVTDTLKRGEGGLSGGTVSAGWPLARPDASNLSLCEDPRSAPRRGGAAPTSPTTRPSPSGEGSRLRSWRTRPKT